MDAGVAIPLGSLILGAAMVVFAAFTFKSQRDDIRMKAEVSYVQSLESQLRSCRESELQLRMELQSCRSEVNQLRTDLVAALYEGQPPSTGLRRVRRPPAEEEE